MGKEEGLETEGNRSLRRFYIALTYLECSDRAGRLGSRVCCNRLITDVGEAQCKQDPHEFHRDVLRLE